VDGETKYYPEYWGGKKLAYPHVAPEAPKFARSVVVGNLVFVSGATGQDTLTGKPTSKIFEEQMVSALDKVKVAMEEVGSSLNNVVKTLMLVKNLEDYPRMRKTEVEYYQKYAPYLAENPPASTFIVPTSLAKPEFLIEIDVIGVIDRNAPGWEAKYYPEYWAGKELAYPHVAPEAPKFARSEVVGNLVFVSGCEGLNADTVKVDSDVLEDQMIVALDKVKMGMEEVGSSLDNIVKTHMLLTKLEDYPRMRKTEMEYYQKHAPYLVENPPASTFLQVASLALPEFLIEIDVIGVIDRDAPGWEVKYYPEYWVGKKLAYPHVAPEAPKFARSEVVGNLVFVSGATGQDTITGEPTSKIFEEQMVSALDKVRVALEETGSSMNNIVKTLMLLKNLEDYPHMRKTELEYYQKHAPFLVENPPASTFIQPASLARPEFLVEMDVVAVISKEKC